MPSCRIWTNWITVSTARLMMLRQIVEMKVKLYDFHGWQFVTNVEISCDQNMMIWRRPVSMDLSVRISALNALENF